MMKQHDWASLCLLPSVVMVAPSYAVDYLSIEEAQAILFPEASAFLTHRLTLTKQQKKQIKSLAGVRQRWDEQAVWSVQQDGRLAGWFIVDNVVGKHEFITYAVALSTDGQVQGVEIMSYRETHGGEVRDPSWLAHFKHKRLDDTFKLDVDIPNISGATLSCRNVTDGVKRILALQRIALSSSVDA